jgi:hypothetical protein
VNDTPSYLVYKHTCLVTGLSYVGYTKKTIEQRWNEHVSIAFDRRPHVKKHFFQNAIKKYGTDAWVHEVLCDGINSLSQALDFEVNSIKNVGSLAPNGYNETLGGRGVNLTCEGRERHRIATFIALNKPDVRQRYLDGIRRSHKTLSFLEKNRAAQKIAQNRPDVIEKKRTKMKELYADSAYVSPVARVVHQFDLCGNFIREFKSAIDASRLTGTNYSKITEVARGLRKQSGGFVWRYVSQ